MKNIRNYFYILTVFVFFVVFLVYFSIGRDNIDSYVVPKSMSPRLYALILVQKASTEDQRNVIKELYVFNRSTDLYQMKENILPTELHLLKITLQEIGYYTDLKSVDRDIQTVQRVFLNGTFGQFFRFYLFGNLNWLVIPIFVLCLFYMKSVQKYERGVLVFYGIASVLIIQGGYNYRYQLTLLPLSLLILFEFVSRITHKTRLRQYKNILITIILLLIIINIIVTYPRLYKESVKHIDIVKSVSSNTGQTEGFTEMAYFINSLPGDKKETFVVNNLPEFYYYTNKFGYYCWLSDDICNTCNGDISGVLYQKSNVQLNQYLKSNFNAKYILSTNSYNEYNARLKEYLQSSSVKAIFKSQDYILYELVD